jgi:anti-sigma factor RsiW
MDKLNGGFGDAPIKREGMVSNPDEFTFECDLRTCAKCAKKYAEWKELYDKEQAEYREHST